MEAQTNNCKNCKTDFVIEPEDFNFYEKMQVPPPTWCPECRLIRRMMFQNERTLYRRSCDLCGNAIIGIVPAGIDRKVYCQPCWWSDKWEAGDYGRDIDFSRPFLEQIKELIHDVPDFSPQSIHASMINSEYCNIASYCKNSYLLFNSDYDEDCQYSTCLEQSKHCMDMYLVGLSESCYMCTNLYKCFRVFFSMQCEGCIDVWFSRDLRGCTNCFGCANLRNKQYYIFNEPYTKEEYFKKIGELHNGSYKTMQESMQKAFEVHRRNPRKYMTGVQNKSVSGDYIFESKNALLSYEAVGTEDSKYCQFLIIGGTKDAYDFTMWGSKASRIYECMGAGNNQDNIKFCFDAWNEAHNIQYSWHILTRNSDLFGCIALRNKQYCILNKQYTKEEYEALLPKVIEHMKAMPYVDAQGREYGYGEFFPPEMSMYGYNETLAQKHFPLTKEQAIAKGYAWKDPEEKNYTVNVEAKDLPDTIQEATDEILQKTIGCEHKGTCNEQCTTAFRFTSAELAFYRRFNLPLPRFCHNCRHYNLLNQRNPIRFRRAICGCAGTKSVNNVYLNISGHDHGDEHCSNEFDTAYPENGPDIVYCEQCYNSEVA